MEGGLADTLQTPEVILYFPKASVFCQGLVCILLTRAYHPKSTTVTPIFHHVDGDALVWLHIVSSG